jgi:hypothetical protein
MKPRSSHPSIVANAASFARRGHSWVGTWRAEREPHSLHRELAKLCGLLEGSAPVRTALPWV